MPDNINNSGNQPQKKLEQPKIKFNRPSFGDTSETTSQPDTTNKNQQKKITDAPAPIPPQQKNPDQTPESPKPVTPSPTPAPTPTAPDYSQPQTQATAGSKKIRAFVKNVKHEEAWLRTPNQSTSGATHVRTFHAKLTDESLAYMDSVINEWLQNHPECDVKLVNTAIGTFTGKIKEPALICQVWV